MAVGGEPQGDAAADARCPTGDHGDPAAAHGAVTGVNSMCRSLRPRSTHVGS
jgi:hypothetical protein